MKVIDILRQQTGQRRFSFEVLPPLKGNGTEALFRTIDKLKGMDPIFINITTHHSEYVYRETDNGQYERLRIRRRPGTIAIAAAIAKTNFFFIKETSHFCFRSLAISYSFLMKL
mgnify:CR=1 FL=1